MKYLSTAGTAGSIRSMFFVQHPRLAALQMVRVGPQSTKTIINFSTLNRQSKCPQSHRPNPLAANTSPAPRSPATNVPPATSSPQQSQSVSACPHTGTSFCDGKPRHDKVLLHRFECRIMSRRGFWLWGVLVWRDMGFIDCFGNRRGHLGCFEGYLDGTVGKG
jgi:hypothetical protein